MSDIEKRIVDFLRGHGVGDECRVDWTQADRLASALASKFWIQERVTVVEDPDFELPWANG